MKFNECCGQAFCLCKLKAPISVSRLDNSVYWMSPGGLMKYNPTRYQKEKSMKPGPYKSSTHGNIKLSNSGRELLCALRNAVVGALERAHDSGRHGIPSVLWTEDISQARGDIAKFMSELEANQKPAAEVGVHGAPYAHSQSYLEALAEKKRHWSVLRDNIVNTTVRFGNRPKSIHNFYFGGIDLAGGGRCQSHLPKEIPMNETDKAEAGPTVEKTRSRTLTEATCELCAAQRDLEHLLGADTTTPETLYLHDGGQMGSAIAPLVLEQWAALSKKALARAKARVAKAEKAVSVLLT